MSAYHLRREGSEYRLNDVESVLRLARVGLIRADDRLRREGEKRFRVATSFKELREALATDTWDAWEALGDSDPDALWAASVEWTGGKEPEPTSEKTVDVPAQAPPAEEPPPPIPPVEEKLVEEKGEAPVQSPALDPIPEEDEDSNVIVFPTPPATPVRRVQSSAKPEPHRAPEPPVFQELMPETVVRRPSAPRQFRAFPWVFGGVAVFGGMILMAIHFHIESTANWTSAGPKGPPPEAVIAEAEAFVAEQAVVETQPSREDLEADALFEQKTSELRERMSRGVVEMKGKPDDLTNALMIEMSRMRVGLLKLKAPVHAWGGRQNDMPVASEIHMVLRSKGDLIEQLGAAVLVVGKYLQAYEMELTDFVVGLENENGIVQNFTPSPEGVRAVYMNRKPLRELLTK